MRAVSRRRGRLSMTSLIDVIFLLLLFFMLSSTFSRFGEIEMPGGGGGRVASGAPMVFVRLTEAGLSVNGQAVGGEDALSLVERFRRGERMKLVLAVAPEARAQAFADTLRLLRRVPEADLVVVE